MRAFVVRGFGKHKDSSGAEIDFDRVDAELITPALEECNLVGGTTGQIVEAGNIRVDMFALIVEADVVICDITVHNANVFYELGIRHALRKKHTVLIRGEPTQDKTPFDLSTDRYLKYPVGKPGDALGDLVNAIRASLNTSRETDSPVFQMLPTLHEVNPDDVSIVPVEVSEEVECAKAAGDKGWLRLIADDLKGERFQMGGLKWVARAQWALKDFDGARKNWETLRSASVADIEPNLALANIYERIYRENLQPSLLEASNQAIRRVLDSPKTALKDRAEALALHGRNLKTLWRLEFKGGASVDRRRAIALDGKLLDSFDAYRQAFLADLNAYYPGISALQMGTILRSFADEAAWVNLFQGNEKNAQRYKEDLDSDLPVLRNIVETATANAKKQEVGDNKMWARITSADLQFLSRPEVFNPADEGQITSAYRDAIPTSNPFAWDATKGQLSLFAELGIKAELANRVIANLDGRFDRPETTQIHLVVFAGHRVDRADAPHPRFPASKEAQAKALIEEKIEALRRPDQELVVLVSAAPGADILAHEVCQQLKVRTILCLPMPQDQFVSMAFEGFDDGWRTRFFALVENRREATFVLGNGSRLPDWLQSKNASVWERGSKWVVRLAQSWGARRTTLLAMWDKDTSAKTSDGTAYMVELAQESGVFALEHIDTRQLLLS
jgi:hypothetical protein